MRQDYSADREKRDLQSESQIHIEVQEEVTERLSREPGLNVASPEFVRRMHGRFYSRLPERLHGCWVMTANGPTSRRVFSVGRPAGLTEDELAG